VRLLTAVLLLLRRRPCRLQAPREGRSHGRFLYIEPRVERSETLGKLQEINPSPWNGRQNSVSNNACVARYAG
jgi:hypothetical protein